MFLEGFDNNFSLYIWWVIIMGISQSGLHTRLNVIVTYYIHQLYPHQRFVLVQNPHRAELVGNLVFACFWEHPRNFVNRKITSNVTRAGTATGKVILLIDFHKRGNKVDRCVAPSDSLHPAFGNNHSRWRCAIIVPLSPV